MRRSFGVAWRVALFALLTLVALEAVFRVAALFAPDRSGAWRAGAEVRVLCVGDSHTYGAGVPDGESYPAQLQWRLDERAPGRYSVVNLGIPGLSTAQVRARLPDDVARYEPDIVLVWSGTNNAWNRSDPARSSSESWLRAAAHRSRLVRFVQVWRRDRALRREAAETRGGGLKQQAKRTRRKDRETWEVRHDGLVESIDNRYGPFLYDAAVEDRAVEDYRAMLDWLRAAGIAAALIQYPREEASFALANRAMERAVAGGDTPLVDARRSLARLPPAEREWRPSLHPGAAIYREIAADVADVVEKLSESP